MGEGQVVPGEDIRAARYEIEAKPFHERSFAERVLSEMAAMNHTPASLAEATEISGSDIERILAGAQRDVRDYRENGCNRRNGVYRHGTALKTISMTGALDRGRAIAALEREFGLRPGALGH